MSWDICPETSSFCGWLSSTTPSQLQLIKIHNLFTLIHPFIPDWYYLMIPNTCITFPLTLCTIYKYRAKTGKNIMEFMHSNWITLSYYSSPKHKSLLHRFWYASLTSIHNNLKRGLAIVTESFSPLNLSYTTSFVKVQTRSHAKPTQYYSLSWVLN